MPRGASLPGPLAGRRRPLAAGAAVGRRARQRDLPQPEDPRPSAPTASTLEQASRGNRRRWPRDWRAERPSHADSARGWCRSPSRPSRSIRPALLLIAGSVGAAAARRQRQRLDAAARARLEPAARAGGSHRAWRDARTPAVAGGRRVARVRRARRLAGLVLGGWALRARAAAVCGLAAARRSRSTSMRASRVVHRRDLGCRSAAVRRRRRAAPAGRRAGRSCSRRPAARISGSGGRARERAGGRAGRARRRAAVGRGADAEQRRQAVARPPGIRRRSSADVQGRADRLATTPPHRRASRSRSTCSTRLEATPGVRHAALLVDRAVRWTARRQRLRDRRPAGAAGEPLIADQRHVSPGYFRR